jgi:dipeptidase
MIRVLAIGFLLIYLTANTELHQFLKLPVFFDHFSEHRQEKPELSLVDFIVLHYFGPDVNDADKDRDHQLPFKCHDCVAACCSVALLTVSSYEREMDEPLNTTNESIYKSPFNPSFFQFTIWQPPRA